jgi:hypothetical protein
MKIMSAVGDWTQQTRSAPRMSGSRSDCAVMIGLSSGCSGYNEVGDHATFPTGEGVASRGIEFITLGDKRHRKKK